MPPPPPPNCQILDPPLCVHSKQAALCEIVISLCRYGWLGNSNPEFYTVSVWHIIYADQFSHGIIMISQILIELELWEFCNYCYELSFSYLFYAGISFFKFCYRLKPLLIVYFHLFIITVLWITDHSQENDQLCQRKSIFKSRSFCFLTAMRFIVWLCRDVLRQYSMFLTCLSIISLNEVFGNTF